MEIKLHLNEVLNMNRTLKLIIEDTQTKAEPLLKFKLLGITKIFEPFVSNFDVIRNEKIMEYGTELESGGFEISKDDSDAVNKFNADIMDLINSEVTVQMEPLKPEDVFDKGLKAEYLIELYPVISV